ncbi:uncharacterized protein [Bemisia tabaci]|uniref:uncharacterized protein n=1 Tax=Bemisia tabaci TaxID=7038 RepID=UPI003B286F49
MLSLSNAVLAQLVFLWLISLVNQEELPKDMLIKEDIYGSTLFVFTDEKGTDYIFRLLVRNRMGTLRMYPLRNSKTWSKVYEKPEYYNRKYRVPPFKIKVTPQGKRERVERLGDVSIRLARRLDGMHVYFNLLRCNCKHYADYVHVVYGTTFGNRWDVGYKPINERCPLHRRVHRNYTEIDWQNFYLKDNEPAVKALRRRVAMEGGWLERCFWRLF